MAAERHYHEESIVESASICPPGVRMLCLFAWSRVEDGIVRTAHELIPVIALAHEIRRFYAKVSNEFCEPIGGCTHKEILKRGWKFDYQAARTTALIVWGSNGGLVAYDDEIEIPPNTISELFSCPWPPEQDEQRLAKDIERLRAKSEEKQKRKLPTPKPETPQ